MSVTKSVAKVLLHRGGAIHGYRILNRNAVRILMYHRFSSDIRLLREQCQHLISNYQPISLRTFVETLNGAAPLPTNAVIITIDDGYRDFYLNGYPVFREFGIPSTIFLVSDFIDQKCWLWWDRIAWAFQESPLDSVSLECGGVSRVFSLKSASDRLKSAQDLTQSLISLPNAERLRILESIPSLVRVDMPGLPPSKYQSLTWSEAKEMASNGVEVGAHTKTHPILSRIGNSQELADEILGSKLTIEKEVGREVIHFCYPNGSADDFNEETVGIVKSSGFLSAVTTERGMNQLKADPFLLRRTGIEPYGNTPYFRELLAGVRAD